VWFDSDHVYFTTKGDNRVWDLDVASQRLGVLYDAALIGEDAPLTGVDNLVVSQSADIYVAEDGGNLEIVVITPDKQVAPVVRLEGQDESEICGPAFSPDGTRLYFSSQRGTNGRGITYEVTGPFRTARTGPPARARRRAARPWARRPGRRPADRRRPAGRPQPEPGARLRRRVRVRQRLRRDHGRQQLRAAAATGGSEVAAAAAAALAAGAAGAAYATRRTGSDAGAGAPSTADENP
jgi:hypothetical protein